MRELKGGDGDEETGNRNKTIPRILFPVPRSLFPHPNPRSPYPQKMI